MIDGLTRCNGKLIYYSKADARKRKRHSRKKRHNKAKVYQCTKCGYYHITLQKFDSSRSVTGGKAEAFIIEKIQTQQGQFVKAMSREKKVWKVEVDGLEHTVIYNRKSKTVETIRIEPPASDVEMME